jgi:hypothetical protein
MGKKHKAEEKKNEIVDNLSDNKSLVSLRLRTIADEYDALLFTNTELIRENRILQNEIRVLLKELDMDENSQMVRKLIRAKALLMG